MQRESLDDEERFLMDPDSWDWDNIVEGVPSTDPYSISEVLLTHDEVALIEPVAIAQGMTVTAFLRHAALERALRHVAQDAKKALR